MKRQWEKKKRDNPNKKTTDIVVQLTKIYIDIQYIASTGAIALRFLDFFTVCVRPLIEFEIRNQKTRYRD